MSAHRHGSATGQSRDNRSPIALSLCASVSTRVNYNQDRVHSTEKFLLGVSVPISLLLSIIKATIMIAMIAFIVGLPSITTVSGLTLNTTSLILPDSAVANVTNSHYIHHCDGRQFGYDLDSTSCTEALSQIDIFSTTQQTYGPRYSGLFDVKLPRRYISCSFPPSQ